MQLKELSSRSSVSTASIKYYLREGLLLPGEAVTPTRARYGEQHLRRLELIQALRQIVHLSIEQIRTLLQLADGGASRLELLATVQRVVLGLDAYGVGSGDVGSELGDAVVRLRQWPDAASDARNALNAQLELMQKLSIPVSMQSLDVYSRAMDSVAALDIRETVAPEDTDQLILTAAVGMHMHSQLLLKLLALAQASHAILALENSNAGSLAAGHGDVNGP
ncbi:MerR family transcriptional regulator [Arthrobacter sp. CJ23]|uniref:MerR family transcriptional regulator n=1 Tax=Arthrobacter sp. CJ23 TaxID=2972479 RepID=UPI00215B83EB|nr:MerR family transcriptional regulator [Arthrobacter sp. CJ23]UVJ38511.1 MerR family transcriptional regulator [Arthrobacter sp. CJ23]